MKYSALMTHQVIEYQIGSLLTDCCLLFEIRSRLDKCQLNCEDKLYVHTGGLCPVNWLDLMRSSCSYTTTTMGSDDQFGEEEVLVDTCIGESPLNCDLSSNGHQLIDNYTKLVHVEHDILVKLEQLLELLLRRWFKRNKSIKKQFRSMRRSMQAQMHLVALGADKTENEMEKEMNEKKNKELETLKKDNNHSSSSIPCDNTVEQQQQQQQDDLNSGTEEMHAQEPEIEPSCGSCDDDMLLYPMVDSTPTPMKTPLAMFESPMTPLTPQTKRIEAITKQPPPPLIDYNTILDLKFRKRLVQFDMINILNRVFQLVLKTSCDSMKQMFVKKTTDLERLQKKLTKLVKKHDQYCKDIKSSSN